MEPEHIAAQVRERSGLDVQAVTLVRSSMNGDTSPSVWAAMTEYGHFWVVEDGERLELFRAVARRTSPDDLLACHSAVEAARRFGVLHPKAMVPRRQRSPAALDNAQTTEAPSAGAHICQACGAAFMLRRQHAKTSQSAQLCARCRHAERERRRYQQDAGYRARRLAYSAARYRQSQESARDAD